MNHKSWRDYCKPIIAKALKDNQGAQEGVIKQALYDAYPFGERARYPYHIWLDEIRVQRGLKQKKIAEQTRQELIDAGQAELFSLNRASDGRGQSEASTHAGN